MHLAVPKHDVIYVFKKSDECFHCIGWIHRPNYLEQVQNNIVPIYILPISNSIFTSIIISCFMSQQKIYTKRQLHVAYKR